MEVFAIVLLLLLFFIPLLLFFGRFRSNRVHHETIQDDNVPRPVIRQAGTGRMRRRPIAVASSSSVSEPLDVDEDEELDESVPYAVKTSKKKEKKKQEKEARRQAEESARDMRSQKQDKYAEMRRRKDEEREAEERRKEEEARAQKAKEEAAANAEFEKWKDAFTVDTEGTLEQELQEENQSLLNNFVDYIKKHKCVGLEDLAAEFHLRTQDTIERILSLERIGRLSGVMDDRGKYIFISFDEMKAVAEYIKKVGRVSIAHLATKSNEFIDLEPKSYLEDVHLNDMPCVLQDDKLDYNGES